MRRARAGVPGPRLSLLDAPWVLLDSRRRPMHIAGLLVLDIPAGSPTTYVRDLVDDMRHHPEVVHPFDRLLDWRVFGSIWPRWRLVRQVHLDDHLRHVTLAAPGDDTELQSTVARLHRSRLDLSRPPWEVYVIDGLAHGRFAVLAKFHHSLVDGVGAVRVLQAAMSTEPDRHGMLPLWAAQRTRRAVDDGSARAPRAGIARSVTRAVTATWRNARDAELVRPYSAPRTSLNSATDQDRSIAMVAVDIERLRKLATSAGGTVNDILLAVCAGAIRQLLLEAARLPRAALVAAVPVSVRPAGADVAGNAITFGYPSLSTDVADVRERVSRIVESSSRAKATLARIDRRALDLHTVLTLAPFVVAQLFGVGARLRPLFNVPVSNFPGPREPLYYNGASVRSIHPVSLLFDGNTLNVTALSYRGQLNMTIISSSAAAVDVTRLALLCQDAVEEIEAAYRNR